MHIKHAITVSSCALPVAALHLFLVMLLALSGCSFSSGAEVVDAVDDTAGTVEGHTVFIRVLDNDEAADPSIIDATMPVNGIVSVVAKYGILYQPKSGFTGTDNFSYTIEGGPDRRTDTANVTVSVRASGMDLLSPADDFAGTVVGVDVLIDVMSNDSGLGLQLISVSEPVDGGTATIEGSVVRYTPYTLPTDRSGYDDFTYTVQDTHGATAEASVRVHIKSSNEPPLAVDDAYTVLTGVTAVLGVTDNDSDPDPGFLEVVEVTAPANGSTSILSHGAVSYTPTTGFTGTDTFSYTVSDAYGGKATATVTLTVRSNTPPVADDDVATTVEVSAVTITVLENDRDADGDSLTILSTTDPTNGTVVLYINTTSVRYTPYAGFTGTDSFTYVVSDGWGGTDSATVTITVTPNTPPVAVDDTATTPAGTSVLIDVLANDSDADGHILRITAVGTPGNGTVTWTSGLEDIGYEPDAGFIGIDTFTYIISDGHGGTDTATVAVTVGANTAPVAVDDAAFTVMDTSVVIDVLANDSDADGHALEITDISTPTQGTANLYLGPGILERVSYTPNTGYIGTDSFTYTVSDGNGGTDVATVTVTIDPAVDPVIRVSVDSSGNQATGSGYFLTGSPVISNDGWYVAFRSAASNLVADDTNGQDDVFLHDLYTRTTTLLSVGHDGFPANGGSRDLAMSADARYVVFRSAATNLVTSDENGVIEDIFLRDTQSGTTTLISLDNLGGGSNGSSYYPDISADGTKIVFYSAASDLVSGDGNGVLDAFLHDTASGTTTRISMGHDGSEADGNSLYPVISADGKFVAFESDATNLVTGDANGKTDIFLYEIATGNTTLVSVDDSGTQGTNPSRKPSISVDGQFVAFESSANNLVSGDTNVANDIFVRDTAGTTTTRVSVVTGGTQSSDYENSNSPAISDDGRYVSFYSYATNLVAGDSNVVSDIFLHDRQTVTTTRVSVDATGTEADGAGVFPEISADGRFVVYYSSATNLVTGDTNGIDDAFRVDVSALP